MNNNFLILIIILICFSIFLYSAIKTESFEDLVMNESEEPENNPPSAIKLSAKSGNKYIKLFWMPPNHGYETLKHYIIILKNTKNKEIKMYQPDDITKEQNTYEIINLDNNTLYEIYIQSVNKFGVSPKSNIIHITPFEGKKIPLPKRNLKNINCLKNGNFTEDKYCKLNENVEPNIDLIEYKNILNKLKESQNKYNFDIAL